MNKCTSPFLILGILMLAACSRPGENIVCNISGTAQDYNGSIEIIDIDGDPRQPLATIEIKSDGTFSGQFEANTSIPYEAMIVYRGQGAACTFFPEKNIVISINGLTPPALVTYSGRNNRQYQKCYQEIMGEFSARQDSLDARRSRLDEDPALVLTPAAFNLYVKATDPDTQESERQAASDSLDVLRQQGLAYSSAYQAIMDEYSTLGHDYHTYRINYAKTHHTPASFCVLTQECLQLYEACLIWPEDDFYYKNMSECFDIYETGYTDRFPGHPFHDKIAQLQENAVMLTGQSHYVDFTLPDAEGVNRTLSELIDGKIAVLDLWASWCGGCRRHSKALIPLYDKYKDRGFTIVGVARELKDDLAWRAALEKDGYPWVNLLAMEPDHWVWSKYGVGNGGGGIFLIGRDGIVVAVNPTVEEIEEYVKKNLDK